MEKFSYLATDKKNHRFKGQVEAVSFIQAKAILRAKNLFIITLKKVQSQPDWLIKLNSGKKVKRDEVVRFTRQLSTMIAAGLSLTQSLAILKEQSGGSLSRITGEILQEVEGGGSFSQALRRYPQIFNKVYLSLIQSGEAAGVLEKVLLRLADNLEKQAEFRAKTKNALIYPVIVIIAMAVVAVIMMVFVVPKLTALYQDFGAELPLVTKILIGMSGFMAKTLPLWLFAGLIGGWSFQRWRKTEKGKLLVDRWMLKLPIIGALKTKVVLTETTRTLALLVESGIAIVEALEIASGAADNEIYSQAIKAAAKDVEKGIPLAAAIGKFAYFPPLVPQMLAVGEETGKVDEVMFKVSHYFETESEAAVKGLTTAIEPLMMILLGIGVAFLVMAIIMPIYNLTSQF